MGLWQGESDNPRPGLLISSSPRQVRLPWKGTVAVLSLVLALTIWLLGLLNSLRQPSVIPVLSLQQQEIALLAEPVVPIPLHPLLLGSNPHETLRRFLARIPLDRLDDRQRLLLAGLTPDIASRRAALNMPISDPVLESLRNVLIESETHIGSTAPLQKLLGKLPDDPLLRSVSCNALGGLPSQCYLAGPARVAFGQLVLSTAVPLLALLSGSLLLLRHLWQLLRSSLPAWPPLRGALTLTLADMSLLVAGGFVILSEVIAPLIIAPLIGSISWLANSPQRNAIGVVVGYGALALPPLTILFLQLRGLEQDLCPPTGWLQWRIQPVGRAITQSVRGWLMVMPPVLLTGQLASRVLGDQGGSNPLLEFVLRSHDFLSLILLATTAIVIAPLFEEAIFRGVLLPVLCHRLGKIWGVFSSALVFAVAHLSVGELLPLLVLGLGLGLLRLSSGRLFPSVLMHALWNGVTFTNLLLLRS